MRGGAPLALALLLGLGAGLLFAAVELALAAAAGIALPAAALFLAGAAEGLALALLLWLLFRHLLRRRLRRSLSKLRRVAGRTRLPPLPQGLDELARLELLGLHLLRRLRRTAVRASSQERTIDLLIDAAPDGMISLNEDFTIARINPVGAALFGYRADELCGRPLDLLLPERNRTTHVRHLADFARGPARTAQMAQDRIVTALRRDGSEFPISASIGKADFDGKGFLVAAIRDLSPLERARVQAEEAAAQARAAAQQAALADRSKTEFLANMSHELRTPLNGIIGFAEMMQLETFGPLGHAKYREYVQDIQAAGAHLLAILSDILDVSRLDLDREPAGRPPTDLSPIVASVVRSFRERLPTGMLLDTAGFDRPLEVLASERAIRQVLLNLVANASRFVNREGGLIAVRALETGDMAGFEVRDSGPGFSPVVLQRFGTPFNTDADSAVSRLEAGTGLGLYICKRIVDGLDGRISLYNGEGAVVSVLFQRKQFQKE